MTGSQTRSVAGCAAAVAAWGLALAAAAQQPTLRTPSTPQTSPAAPAPTGIFRRAAPPAQLVLSRRGDRLHASLWSLQRIGGHLALGLCQTEAEGTPADGRLTAPVVPFHSFAQTVDAQDARRGVGVVRLRFMRDGVVVASDSFDCGRGGDLTGLYRPSRSPAVTRVPDGPPLPAPSAGLMYRAIHGDPPASPPPKP